MSSTGQDLYRKARKLIPGGTQLLSKRPEMLLPEQWPSYFAKAQGAQFGTSMAESTSTCPTWESALAFSATPIPM